METNQNPTNPTIKFSTAGQPKGTYIVRYTSGRYGNLVNEAMGTVTKNDHGVWVTTHRDGTAGPGAWSRIDAAWALLNA